MSFERKHCIVKSCDKKSARKFSLPSDAEGAKLWLELLGRKDLENYRNTTNLRVCDAHFAPHMMTASGKRLVQWAIPYKVVETSNKNGEIQNVNDKQQKIEIKKIGDVNTKQQITSITQVVNNATHQDVETVLNFEIKDDSKNIIEKATIIKTDTLTGKVDRIEMEKNEVQTVIETLKVDAPPLQTITLNPQSITIPSKNLQTASTIQNNTSQGLIVTSQPSHKTITVLADQNVNKAVKKRKPAVNQHKSKIRKSDLINLAQQAINEAKNPPSKDEDQFDLIGKRIAIDLRHMDGRQKAIAEKLVNDVLYYGKIGQLRETSSFNPFYSSAPAPVVSTAPTVIHTAVQSSNQHQQQSQPQQTRQIQSTPVATAVSTQTLIPPVGSLITATPIVSTVQVAGTNQIIYAVANQSSNPTSTITINGQPEQANDKCQWWSRNLAYM